MAVASRCRLVRFVDGLSQGYIVSLCPWLFFKSNKCKDLKCGGILHCGVDGWKLVDKWIPRWFAQGHAYKSSDKDSYEDHHKLFVEMRGDFRKFNMHKRLAARRLAKG